MARGLPDASDVVKHYDLYALHDMSELAARLGSPMTYDRYGNVLMMEDFERGMSAWWPTLWGDNAEISLTGDRVYNGRMTCYANSGTGTRPEAVLSKVFPTLTRQKVGMQSAFSIGHNVTQLRWHITWGPGDREHRFAVAYEHTTGKLYYHTLGDNWVEFAEVGDVYDAVSNTHHCKLVVDLLLDEYCYFRFDNVTYSMEGLKPYLFGGAHGPFINVMLTVRGTNTAKSEVWWDNVFITYNEA